MNRDAKADGKTLAAIQASGQGEFLVRHKARWTFMTGKVAEVSVDYMNPDTAEEMKR